MIVSELLRNQGHSAFESLTLSEISSMAESGLSSTAVGHVYSVFGRATSRSTGGISPSVVSWGPHSSAAWKAMEPSSMLSNQRAFTDVSGANASYRSLIEALEKIASFSGLPENWDSYGGVGLSDEARHAALQFVVQLLTDTLLNSSIDLDILPIPTGGIQFEWSGPGGDLEVEIDQDGHFHSLMDPASGDTEESSRDRPLSWLEVRSQIRGIMG